MDTDDDKIIIAVATFLILIIIHLPDKKPPQTLFSVI